MVTWRASFRTYARTRSICTIEPGVSSTQPARTHTSYGILSRAMRSSSRASGRNPCTSTCVVSSRPDGASRPPSWSPWRRYRARARRTARRTPPRRAPGPRIRGRRPCRSRRTTPRPIRRGSSSGRCLPRRHRRGFRDLLAEVAHAGKAREAGVRLGPDAPHPASRRRRRARTRTRTTRRSGGMPSRISRLSSWCSQATLSRSQPAFVSSRMSGRRRPFTTRGLCRSRCGRHAPQLVRRREGHPPAIQGARLGAQRPHDGAARRMEEGLLEDLDRLPQRRARLHHASGIPEADRASGPGSGRRCSTPPPAPRPRGTRTTSAPPRGASSRSLASSRNPERNRRLPSAVGQP